ncbi:PREDICTED: mitochondrial fission regulator 1-like isoform X2 [Priapulus caudatus]|uniref:Mitochondrial fission regulator 1-like isoform X2 n=1 Tax=Priapulus caudatus TaxID=37621 RepID=A0ABM1E4Y2_PRICU|nr:PREDICTED: mitochondrial fission regulator 1-like isoform X2 [Priapulus caudatus]
MLVFGSNRSFIRKLASHLPIQAGRRVYLPLLSMTEYRYNPERVRAFGSMESLDSLSTYSGTCSEDAKPSIAPLTDVGWLNEECATSTKLRVEMFANNLKQSRGASCQPDDGECPRASTPILEVSQQSSFTSHRSFMTTQSSFSDPTAMTKISALEDELVTLRQQIALILTTQNAPHTPCAPLPTPVTPADQQTCFPMPTPPPPPPPAPIAPPPPPPLGLSTNTLVQDLIKQRKGANQSKSPVKMIKTINMSEVLQGLGTVKLRQIKRSPGGTPVRKDPLPCITQDPTMLIAQALKKKFAHCYVWSPDKENRMSPEGSPVERRTPPFGPHLLKPMVKRKSGLTERQSLTSSPLTELNI